MASKRAPTAKHAGIKSAARKRAEAVWGADSITYMPTRVTPHLPNPNDYARYMLMQNSSEVGLVFVKGVSVTNCLEVWLLYNNRITGFGETGAPRAQYVFPSYQTVGNQAVSVTTTYIFTTLATTVAAPRGVTSTQYQIINANCT